MITLNSIKGFNRNMQCRGFQFETGKTYEIEGDVVVCDRGFHAIEGHPLEVFQYYPPAMSRYAEVIQSGNLARHSEDSKVASSIIQIGAEIPIHDLINRAVRWAFARAEKEQNVSRAARNHSAASATGYKGAASATGEQGAASATGNYGAASATGYKGAASATGYKGAASATGEQGAASATGNYGAASATGTYGAASATGEQGAASATGNHSAASATGDHSAASATGTYGAASATGDHSAASATGTYGAASATGYKGAASATGEQGAAMSCGLNGKVHGAVGNALFLTRRDGQGEITHVWAGIAGQAGIKAETWYTLDDNGQPIEVK